MSRFDFPADEFAQRRLAALAAMERAGLSWFVVFHPTSIHWLTGSQAKGYQAFQCLLLDVRASRIIVFTRESERIEWIAEALFDQIVCWGPAGGADPVAEFVQLARSLGVFAAGAVGMEVPAYYLHPHHYVRLKDAFTPEALRELPRLIHDLRLVKSGNEIVCIREAARIADSCMVAVAQQLAEGRTEREIASAIYRTALEQGADVPTVPVNFASGPRAGFSHGAPSSHRLARGDIGNVEFCIPFKRHTVSLGRQFSIGAPGPRLSKVHDAVRAAADACIAQVRDGVPARVPHAAARAVLLEAGLAEHQAHTLGYAVAAAFPPATGELLGLAETSPDILEAGMLLSICPNVYIGEEHLGVRLVDNVLVTHGAAEVLSSLPRDIVVAKGPAWNSR